MVTLSAVTAEMVLRADRVSRMQTLLVRSPISIHRRRVDQVEQVAAAAPAIGGDALAGAGGVAGIGLNIADSDVMFCDGINLFGGTGGAGGNATGGTRVRRKRWCGRSRWKRFVHNRSQQNRDWGHYKRCA